LGPYEYGKPLPPYGPKGFAFFGFTLQNTARHKAGTILQKNGPIGFLEISGKGMNQAIVSYSLKFDGDAKSAFMIFREKRSERWQAGPAGRIAHGPMEWHGSKWAQYPGRNIFMQIGKQD